MGNDWVALGLALLVVGFLLFIVEVILIAIGRQTPKDSGLFIVCATVCFLMALALFVYSLQ